MISVLPDAVITNAATPVTINVLANDTGTGLTITSFSNPANGSLVFNGDKTFTYTPASGFIGDDSFAYTVRDAQGTPGNTEVTISVVADTGATVATDDLVKVIAGDGVVIPVLANDMVAGGGELQIIAVSTPGHGVVNVLPDQTIRYVPQSGFIGIDSFNYTVVDELGASASATVTVKVMAKSNPPLAIDNTFTIEAGASTMLAVLANDSAPDDGPLQVVGYTMPTHGQLVFNADNTFIYTPAAGYLGNDQFTYTIRDKQGASASASVTLVVAEIPEIPVAFDDQVTTEAGVPVTIDILANDTLPAGQQISIVAVTLPFKGKLAFNPDKTIAYTPNPGFVGIDDFTYTIGNGQGGTAKATVTLEVMPATVSNTYQNGYSYRRRIVLPAQSESEASVNDVVILVHEQETWLKNIEHGGKVNSPNGDDIRFENMQGSKLDHDIESYDPESGKLLAWVRLPKWELGDHIQIFLFYGNSTLLQGEVNPASVWQGYLSRWRFPDGSDSTEQGRNLAPEGVTSDTLLGRAARFDGNSNFSLSETPWLEGLSAITMQALVKPDTRMIGTTNGIVVQGSPDSTRWENGITLSYIAETSGGVQNVVHAKVRCSDGVAFTLSDADRQTNAPQLIHSTWQSGNAPILYLDGIKQTSSGSSTCLGLTNLSEPLHVGAGWQGLIDEVRLSDRALAADWIAFEARNMLTPELSYGLGHEETIGAEAQALVAVPFVVSTTSDKFVNIDVLSKAVDSTPTGELSLNSVTQPAHGIATVVNGIVRYTPNANFTGGDQLTYMIGNGTVSAIGKISVTVLDAQPSTPDVDINTSLPVAERTITVSTQAAFASALAAAQPGDHIVLANGTYTGPGNFDRDGTAAKPIVIRSANLLGATIAANSLHLRGAYQILHGINFTSPTMTIGNGREARHTKLWRCRFMGNGASTTSIFVRTYDSKDLDVAYCEWTNHAGRGISIIPEVGTLRTTVRRCLFHNQPLARQNATEAIQISFANRSSLRSLTDSGIVIKECRFHNWNNDDELISIKTSGVLLKQLSIEDCNGNVNCRNGRFNNIEAVEIRNGRGITITDGFNKVAGCKQTNTVSYTNQQWECRSGTVEDGIYPDNLSLGSIHNRGRDCVFAGCETNTGLLIGNGRTSGPEYRSSCIGTRVREFAGTVTLKSGTMPNGQPWQSGTDSQPGTKETLYAWAPLMWLTDSDVGPLAL